MGHANRPRLDDAVSVDAQSRSVRLSLVGRRRHSHAHSNRDTNSDSNSYSYSYCYRNRNRNRNRNTWSQVHSYTEATPHAKTASLGANWQQLVLRCGLGDRTGGRPQVCLPRCPYEGHERR